jgi:alkanesulfonate monooxygenase SsuD/methylene tetrahydromethanopterin reductase-like flavin-dependent oxidoreductase (luciferase family)
MRFGAHYLVTYVPELDGPTEVLYQHLFEQLELLDSLGFDDAWVTEHHFAEYGGTISHPPTFLAAAARTTQRIHLGVAISVVPMHNPLQLAESYAMVDVVSNGRLEFGIGRGNAPHEFSGMGVRSDDSVPRIREATQVIQQAWSGEPVNFHGEIFDYEDVRVFPPPVQRPHPPIWVAASRSDDSYRWAGWNGFNLMVLPHAFDPAVLQEHLGMYRDALIERGHDPAQREILGKFHVYIAERDADARRDAATYLANYSASNRGNPSRRPATATDGYNAERQQLIAGEPERCADLIHEWCERAGLTAFSATLFFGGMPQELALNNIRLFAERVIPTFEPTPARA